MHREMVETFIKTPFEEYVAKPICVSGKAPPLAAREVLTEISNLRDTLSSQY